LVHAAIPGIGRAVASGLPELMPNEVATDLAASGVTSFGGIPTALRALKAHTLASAPAQRLRDIASAAEDDARNDAAANESGTGLWLAEHEAKQLLASFGVTVPAGRVATSAAEAVHAAEALGAPVAMKISHGTIQHKSDVGGVVLGLSDAFRISASAEQLLTLEPDGVVLVESMAASGLEVLVSATRDGVVPSLVIGTGGIWTEVLHDVVVIPLPAPATRIHEALRTLRSYPMLDGGRGQVPLAVAALCELAAAAGRALLSEPLSLVELNPVIVSTDKAVAVDAVVRR
jgi:acyl-CoA synthetase (NDP forming)